MKKSASWFASLVLAATMGAGISTAMNAGAAAKPAPVTFYACLKAGALSNVTTLKHSCARGYSAVSWNEVGEMGLTGDNGAQGPKGDAGVVGPQGVQGPKGDTGAQGVQGVTGAQGPKGDTGPQGPSPAGGYFLVMGAKENPPNFTPTSGTCPDGSTTTLSGGYVGGSGLTNSLWLCPFPTN